MSTKAVSAADAGQANVARTPRARVRTRPRQAIASRADAGAMRNGTGTSTCQGPKPRLSMGVVYLQYLSMKPSFGAVLGRMDIPPSGPHGQSFQSVTVA